MLNSPRTSVLRKASKVAGVRSQQRLVEEVLPVSAALAADRSSLGGSDPVSGDSVLQQDRRQRSLPSPNSRRNRSRRPPEASSHLQDRELKNMPQDASRNPSAVATNATTPATTPATTAATTASPEPTVFVGIDVSKSTLDVAIRPEGRGLSVANDSAGFKKLLTQLPASEGCLVTVEATGGYQDEVVSALIEHGYRVATVNPKRVRDYAKGLGLLAKTDKLDALVIAATPSMCGPFPHHCSRPNSWNCRNSSPAAASSWSCG